MAIAETIPSPNTGITEIASRVRRHPEWVLSLLVSSLVHEASERWRGAHDLLEVTDEVPITAWVVRRKSDLLLPGATPAEEPGVEEPGDAAPWIPQSVQDLRVLLAQAQERHGGCRRLEPGPPAPVKGATPWTLAWSWPKLKIPKMTTPTRIQPEVDPVRERLARIRDRMKSDGLNGIGFEDLVGSPRTLDRVATFLALTQLWHRRELVLEQTQAYGPIWVRPERIFDE